MDLPNGWSAVRLSEVCTVIDVDHKMPKSQPNGIPFISAKDLVGSPSIDFSETKFISEEDYRRQAKKCTPKKNDVLFSRIGTIGVARLVKDDRKFGISYSLCVVRPSEKVVPEYLEALMNSEVVKKQATTGTQSIAVPDLGLKQIRDFLIPLPPLNAQKRITSIYERITRLKDLRRQANQLTDRIIQSAFLKMFGDPASNPKGWSTACFGDIIRKGPQNGLYKHSSFYGSGAPIVRINNFYDGVLFSSNLRRVRVTHDEIRTYKLDLGDILINRVNSPEFVGKCALVEHLSEDTVFESNMMRFKLDSERAIEQFIITFLLTDYAKAQILSKSRRAVHQVSINQEDVKSIQLYLPPRDLQIMYAQIVKKTQLLMGKQRHSTEEINELFQSLMQKAFRGELAAEASVSGVV